MSNVILALDIGGSKINSALIDARSLRIIKRLERLPSQPPATSITEQGLVAVDTLVKTAHQLHFKPIACGAVVAGQVGWPSGIVHWGSNVRMNTKIINLRRVLEHRTHLPAIVDNDVHGFLLAESRLGITKKREIAAAINLGTGIGGAVMINGSLVRGPNNTTGEFGHMTIDFGSQDIDLPRCGDGMRGHWEEYASGLGIMKWYRYFQQRHSESAARRILSRSSAHTQEDGLTPLIIEQRYTAGEPVAEKTVTLARTALAHGLANIIISLNPDMIVLGGGLIRMKPLMNNIAAETKKLLPFPATCRILRTKLGDDAQLIGAALLTKGR